MSKINEIVEINTTLRLEWIQATKDFPTKYRKEYYDAIISLFSYGKTPSQLSAFVGVEIRIIKAQIKLDREFQINELEMQSTVK